MPPTKKFSRSVTEWEQYKRSNIMYMDNGSGSYRDWLLHHTCMMYCFSYYNHNTQCSIFFSQTCVVYGSLDSNFHLHLQVFCSRDFKPMFINKILCCFSLHLRDFNPSFLFFFYFIVFWTYGRVQTNPWMEMQSTDRPPFRICKWTLKHESISVWCPETSWGSFLQQGSNSQPECRKKPVITIGPWLQPYFH